MAEQLPQNQQNQENPQQQGRENQNPPVGGQQNQEQEGQQNQDQEGQQRQGNQDQHEGQQNNEQQNPPIQTIPQPTIEQTVFVAFILPLEVSTNQFEDLINERIRGRRDIMHFLKQGRNTFMSKQVSLYAQEKFEGFLVYFPCPISWASKFNRPLKLFYSPRDYDLFTPLHLPHEYYGLSIRLYKGNSKEKVCTRTIMERFRRDVHFTQCLHSEDEDKILLLFIFKSKAIRDNHEKKWRPIQWIFNTPAPRKPHRFLLETFIDSRQGIPVVLLERHDKDEEDSGDSTAEQMHE